MYKIKIKFLPESRQKQLICETANWVTSSSCPVQPTLSSISRVVTHDVPVDVIPRRLWHEFKEPSMPDFDVSDVAMKC